MSEWKRVKLKELIKEVNERNKGEKVKRVLSVTNSRGFVSQEEYFEGTVHSANISNYKIVRKNQFAYNPSRVNVGSIDILKDYEEGALSPMYIVFEVDTTKLLPDYFKYYFQTNRFFENVKNNTQGSVRNSLSFKALSDFDYLLPPIEEQEKIVEILKTIDSIIEKHESLLEEKNQFIKSQFVEMFGNEKNKIKLKDACYIKGRIGWQRLNRKEYLKKGDYYLVTGVDIMNNHRIDFNKCFYVSKERYEKDSKIQLKSGDIILTKDGTIGKVAMIYELDKPATLNSHLFVIRDISGNFDNIYFLNLFLSDIFMNFANKKTNGSTRKGLSQASIENFDIPLPAMTKQMEFRKIYELIDKQKFLLEKQKQNYENLRKGLMQKLLTGKVRVKI